jgi:hypothetical protein
MIAPIEKEANAMRRSTQRNRFIAIALMLAAPLALALLWLQPTAARQVSEQPALARSQQAGAPPIYLPIVRRGVNVTPLQFASAIDAFGVPIDPDTTFSYGITKLYASTVVTGGQNQVSRTLFIRPNGFGSQAVYTIPSAEARVTTSISGTPLDRGTYTIKFFLDGVLLQQGTVVIQ